ncbi:MAG: type 4a pilus biogenesis protein PilO [Candidatus Paceibacterota bacterium]|jgi:Tfp pilus assembly protein PilO
MITRLVIPIALVIAAIALFFALTQPAMGVLQTKQEEKKTIDDALDNAKKIKKIQDNLLAAKQAIPSDKIDNLNKLLPDTIDNVQLIIDVNNIALKYGSNMALRNIKVRTDDGMTGGKIGPNTKKYGTVFLNFTVTGPYSALKQFLNDLEVSLRLIDITGLTFTAGEKESYEYNFEIKTYWLK